MSVGNEQADKEDRSDVELDMTISDVATNLNRSY
jgi:hypothetical protein